MSRQAVHVAPRKEKRESTCLETSIDAYGSLGVESPAHMLAQHFLDYAFNPRSIAVAGFSDRLDSAGRGYVSYILEYGFKGPVYPVNPRLSEFNGLKCYHSVKDIPGPVDFVISCVPAEAAPDVARDCAEKGVKVMHLFTARFSETGDEHATGLESRLLEEARRGGVRLIGPNCMGIYNPRSGVTYAKNVPLDPGGVGAFMQSGGNATEFVRLASSRGMRFSKVVSYGNALDVDEADFLEYLAADPDTRVIAAYIEGLKRGRVFLDRLAQATKRKPVIILKGGHGTAGARSAASHTGALAGSYATWQGALKQAGAVEATSMEDLIDLVVAFDRLPAMSGARVGIVCGGGGGSVASADAWEENGFVLSPLPETAVEQIRGLGEMWARWATNPLDMSIVPISEEHAIIRADLMKSMLQNTAFDLTVFRFTPLTARTNTPWPNTTEADVHRIVKSLDTRTHPVLAILDTGALSTEDLGDKMWQMVADDNSTYIKSGVPVFRSDQHAARAVRKVIDYYRNRQNRLR